MRDCEVNDEEEEESRRPSTLRLFAESHENAGDWK